MTGSAGWTRFVDWLFAVPHHVPDGMVRYYLYWKFLYFFGGIAHVSALCLFLLAGVEFMFLFNIFSVATFAAAFVLLQNGYYRTAFWGINVELILHGLAATVCVGPLYSFQSFAILVVILSFIQPFYRTRVSVLLAGAAILSATLVMLYAARNPPVYAVPAYLADLFVAVPMLTFPLFVLAMVLPFVNASARAEEELAAAYDESESLLLNILPEPIARRLKSTHGMIADDYDRVAILFADIVGFTQMSHRLQPAEVVTLLNAVFEAIDGLVERYGAEKIKTIGDAYMVVTGLPEPTADPDAAIASLALDIQATVSQFKEPGTGAPVQVRIGLNSGKVVAGVIGHRKFAYDLWGDAVNVAARMEAASEEGRIQVTDEFATGLADRFTFERRGEIEVKGKGRIATSFLTGRKSETVTSAIT